MAIMRSSVGFEPGSGSVTRSLASNSRALTTMKHTLSVAIDKSGPGSAGRSDWLMRKRPYQRPPRACVLSPAPAAQERNLTLVHEHRAHGLIGSEVIDAFDRQQLRQPSSRAIDAAFDRSDRAAADLRRLLIGKARSSNQDQGFALIRGQLGECAGKLLELQAAGLLGLRFEGLRIRAVVVLDLAAALAIVGSKQVAENREEPCGHVGARLELVDVGKRAQQCLLHEVVGFVDASAQRDGESTQARDRAEHGFPHRVVELVAPGRGRPELSYSAGLHARIARRRPEMRVPRGPTLLARVPGVKCRAVLFAVTHRRFRDLVAGFASRCWRRITEVCGQLTVDGSVRSLAAPGGPILRGETTRLASVPPARARGDRANTPRQTPKPAPSSGESPSHAPHSVPSGRGAIGQPTSPARR